MSRSFHCRQCGQFHQLTHTEEAATRGEPPWTVTCGGCGSGYQILADRIHHYKWGPNWTGTPRIVRHLLPPINKRVTLPPLPPPKGK